MEILSWQSGGDLVQTQILRSHTRTVSDLNWHRFDPNLLASCSLDTFIHVWDIRDQRRPSLSLSAVGKAMTRSQIDQKYEYLFSFLAPFLLASLSDI